MNNKYVTAVVVLLMLAIGVVVLIFMTQGLAGNKASQEEQQKLARQTEELLKRDIKIYWIGELPANLKGISPVTEFPDAIDSTTMPVKSPEFHTIERDAEGKVVNERIPVTYPKYLYIVINEVVLTEEELQVVRDCVSENGVNLIVIGDKAIQNVRTFMLLPSMTYAENDTMFYSAADGSDSHIYTPDKNPRKNAIGLLEYINGRTEAGITEESEDGN